MGDRSTEVIEERAVPSRGTLNREGPMLFNGRHEVQQNHLWRQIICLQMCLLPRDLFTDQYCAQAKKVQLFFYPYLWPSQISNQIDVADYKSSKINYDTYDK